MRNKLHIFILLFSSMFIIMLYPIRVKSDKEKNEDNPATLKLMENFRKMMIL